MEKKKYFKYGWNKKEDIWEQGESTDGKALVRPQDAEVGDWIEIGGKAWQIEEKIMRPSKGGFNVRFTIKGRITWGKVVRHGWGWISKGPFEQDGMEKQRKRRFRQAWRKVINFACLVEDKRKIMRYAKHVMTSEYINHYRVLNSKKWEQTVIEEREKLLSELGYTKRDVITLIKEAVEIAKDQRSAKSMLAAAALMGKYIGMDAGPDKNAIDQTRALELAALEKDMLSCERTEYIDVE